MKILIAYYSRTKNTEKIAKKLQQELNCDLEKIDDLNQHKGIVGWIKGGYKSNRNKGCKIKKIEKNPENYDLTIIGSPVWASNIASPIITYIKNNKFNKIACFVTCNKGGDEKAINNVEKLTSKKLMAKMSLNKKTIKNSKNEINKFLKKVN